MKYEVEATEDIDRRYGDRTFKNQKGDKRTENGNWFEVAMSAPMNGAYKLVREIPDTDAEKAKVKTAEKVTRLAKQPKKTLVKKAAKLGIIVEPATPKEPLAAEIVKTEAEGDK